MRVYEAIGETLKKLEVRATFGLMGDGNLRFMTHLAHELGMPYYAARHEGGAVAMADDLECRHEPEKDRGDEAE